MGLVMHGDGWRQWDRQVARTPKATTGVPEEW